MTALGPSHPDRPFHGLWSLWEMQKIRFGELIGQLQSMLTFGHLGTDDAAPLEPGIRLALPAKLKEVRQHCEQLQLVVPIDYIDNSLMALSVPPRVGEVGSFARAANMIMNTIEIELRNRLLFALEPMAARYFDNPNLLGGEFSKNFQSASYDADEAGKCFATGRYTAAVFHLMRVMEFAIRAVASCVGVPDPTKPAERNWGFILREMKTAIGRRNGGSPPWINATDKDAFESAYTSLDAVRITWRNPTMHPANKYTEDEAEHIFGAVRGFMMRLAERCDENGDPKA